MAPRTMTQRRLRFPLVICLVSLCVFGPTLGHPTHDTELAELTSKVDAIDSKLDVLSEDINRKLDTLIEIEEAEDHEEGSNVSGTEGPDQGPGEGDGVDSASTPPVEILSVERSPVDAPTSSKFSVRFSSRPGVDSDAIFTRVYADNYVAQNPESLVEESPGLWLAEFTVDRTAPRGVAPFVYIGTDDDYMIGLRLDNGQSESASQGTVRAPALSTVPAMEAVYEPGQNVTVTVSSPYMRTGGASDSYLAYFSGVDFHTNTFDYALENVFHLIDEGEIESLPNKMQQTFTLLTSTHAVSGLMEIVQHETVTGGSLVQYTMTSKLIKVRPSNQTSYFPPDFLSFMVKNSPPKSSSGNDLFTCRNVTSCTPTCSAVGASISDLEVFKVLPDDTLVNMTSLNPPVIRETYKTIYWHVDNQDGSLQAGDIVTYQCVAYDTINRNMVTKRIDVWIA